jgi:hypothetical protein
MIYVKVNDTLYPATVNGRVADNAWDNRESKAITLEGDYETINALFVDGTTWSIVMDEEGTQTEYDNSEFNIRGDITVHTDGTCTVKMGKETDLESAYTLLYGGVE